MRPVIRTLSSGFVSTGIGSMPFTDPDYASDISLKYFPDAPFWPQLPRAHPHEDMITQFSESIPGICYNSKKKRVFFDTSLDHTAALTHFYQTYMENTDLSLDEANLSLFSMSADFSRGLFAFDNRLDTDTHLLPIIKLQTTGPCTFALSALDQSGRPIYYNEEFRDVIVKALAMKCRWQIQMFRKKASTVICFLDEPVLSAFGSSAYLGVRREDVVSLLAEVVAAIHHDNALAAIHCCGNTEWSIPVDAGVDIVNFDAFEYGETIALYRDCIEQYMSNGGMLAWGIVPTSEAIHNSSPESLAAHMEKLMDHLASKGIDKTIITGQALITPACGTGFCSPDDALKIFELTAATSDLMRSKYGR